MLRRHDLRSATSGDDLLAIARRGAPPPLQVVEERSRSARPQPARLRSAARRWLARRSRPERKRARGLASAPGRLPGLPPAAGRCASPREQLLRLTPSLVEQRLRRLSAWESAGAAWVARCRRCCRACSISIKRREQQARPACDGPAGSFSTLDKGVILLPSADHISPASSATAQAGDLLLGGFTSRSHRTHESISRAARPPRAPTVLKENPRTSRRTFSASADPCVHLAQTSWMSRRRGN